MNADQKVTSASGPYSDRITTPTLGILSSLHLLHPYPDPFHTNAPGCLGLASCPLVGPEERHRRGGQKLEMLSACYTHVERGKSHGDRTLALSSSSRDETFLPVLRAFQLVTGAGSRAFEPRAFEVKLLGGWGVR